MLYFNLLDNKDNGILSDAINTALTVYESVGREFESLQARQQIQGVTEIVCSPFFSSLSIDGPFVALSKEFSRIAPWYRMLSGGSVSVRLLFVRGW